MEYSFLINSCNDYRIILSFRSTSDSCIISYMYISLRITVSLAGYKSPNPRSTTRTVIHFSDEKETITSILVVLFGRFGSSAKEIFTFSTRRLPAGVIVNSSSAISSGIRSMLERASYQLLPAEARITCSFRPSYTA